MSRTGRKPWQEVVHNDTGKYVQVPLGTLGDTVLWKMS